MSLHISSMPYHVIIVGFLSLFLALMSRPAYAMGGVSLYAEDMNITHAGTVFVQENQGKSELGMTISAQLLEQAKSLRLCRKRYFMFRSKCQTIPFRGQSGVDTMAVEFDANVLRDGTYQLRLMANRDGNGGPLARSKQFQILKAGKLHKDSPLDIEQADLGVSWSDSELFLLLKMRPISFGEHVRIRLFDGVTGRRLSSVHTVIDGSKRIPLGYYVQLPDGRGRANRNNFAIVRDLFVYVEIEAYTAAWKELMRHRNLVYRAAFPIQTAAFPRNLTEEQVFVTVEMNSGDAFQGDYESLGSTDYEDAVDNASELPNEVSVPTTVDFKAFNPRLEYMKLIDVWQNAYDRSTDSFGGKFISDSLKTLYGESQLDDVIIYTAIRTWLKDRPQSRQDEIHVINPRVITSHDWIAKEFGKDYPRMKRYHILPFWNVERSHWILLIFDKKTERFLVADSQRLKTKYDYQVEFGVFSHLLVRHARLRTIPHPTAELIENVIQGEMVHKLKTPIPKTDLAWPSLVLWESEKRMQQKDNYNSGVYVIMNAIFLIGNDLVETIANNQKENLPRMTSEQADVMRARLFVGLGAKCQHFDPDISFPDCLVY